MSFDVMMLSLEAILDLNVFSIAAIIGSLISGALIGAVPAVCGLIRQRFGLAVLGFVSCVIASFLLGLILALPVCALFLFLIFRY